MKKILLLMGVGALALTSCSQEDVLGVNDGKSRDNMVTFRVRTPKIPRSQEYTTDNLQSFMVYGFKGVPEDAYDAGETLKPFFNDEGTPVEYSRKEDNLFRSETPYYYPTDGSNLYFAAIAPGSLTSGITTDDFGGLKIANYTVDPDISKQLDIIVDNGAGHIDYNEGYDMELAFHHALTKVFISKVANSGNPYRYEIMGVKFGNIHTSGTFEYRGERVLKSTGEEENPYFDADGFLCDYIGNGIYWKGNGEQTGEITYLFENPIILDAENTSADVMSDDSADPKGSFMMIPQKLSSKFISETEKEYGTIEGQEFDPGMTYIAFLVRIRNTDKEFLATDDDNNPLVDENGNTYIDEECVVYPYSDGSVDAISKEIDGVTYAWAAFPVSTLWVPQMYVDYFVDFSKGAGFVAPGADSTVECKPILSNEIKFTETVDAWNDGSETTVDHEGENGTDVGNTEDPFGE